MKNEKSPLRSVSAVKRGTRCAVTRDGLVIPLLSSSPTLERDRDEYF